MKQHHVQWLGSVLMVLALVIGSSTSVVAGDTDPLFVNLTSDDTHRAAMALGTTPTLSKSSQLPDTK